MTSLAAVDTSSLALFYRDVKRVERMNREEELVLAKRWHEQQDRDAAEQLVRANLYAVASIAREYRHFGLQESDLIQEGTLGLMHAVKRFDPERGFRLMTYASWWVRASIHEFILKSWSIVKLGTTKLQRKIFAGLRKAQESIAAVDGREADIVGEQYGISGNAFQEAAQAYLQRDVSLDAEIEGQSMVETLPSAIASPEDLVMRSSLAAQQQSQLKEALLQLSQRDRFIIERRHLQDTAMTLKDLSEILEISLERVRQLEARAMKKMRAFAASDLAV
ncbi:MAG: RNA polymerase factor sigma-32 [Mariprofundaceae bacterium]|nr:RNA polymerase factor sigma-32 [Mariprofundaceae bacterium]